MDTRVTPSVQAPGPSPTAPHSETVANPAESSGLFHLAKFGIGQVVKHRVFSFRGVIFDVDPVFANTEEWWLAIPAEVRPRKDQPFYHLLAENDEGGYVAYVSEQNLLPDTSGEPVGNPNTSLIFDGFFHGHYHLRPRITH
jgi:heat shock protein HspQ